MSQIQFDIFGPIKQKQQKNGENCFHSFGKCYPMNENIYDCYPSGIIGWYIHGHVIKINLPVNAIQMSK